MLDKEGYRPNVGIILANTDGGEVDESMFVSSAVKVGKSIDDAQRDIELYAERVQAANDLKQAEALVADEVAAVREHTAKHEALDELELRFKAERKAALEAINHAGFARASIENRRRSLLRSREILIRTADPAIGRKIADIEGEISANHVRLQEARRALHQAKSEHGKKPEAPDRRMLDMIGEGLSSLLGWRSVDQPDRPHVKHYPEAFEQKGPMDKSAEISELEALVARCENRDAELRQLLTETIAMQFDPEQFAIDFANE